VVTDEDSNRPGGRSSKIKLSFGGTCKISKIPKVDMELSSEDPKEKWQQRISEVGEDAVVIFIDRSKIKEGGVGVSWWD